MVQMKTLQQSKLSIGTLNEVGNRVEAKVDVK